MDYMTEWATLTTKLRVSQYGRYLITLLPNRLVLTAALIKVRPSGLKTTEVTAPECPDRVRISFPVDRFQILMIFTASGKFFPSGLKVIGQAGFCLRRSAISLFANPRAGQPYLGLHSRV